MSFSKKAVVIGLLLVMLEQYTVRALYRSSKLPASQVSRVAGGARPPMSQLTRFYSENPTTMPSSGINVLKNTQEKKNRIKNWELEIKKAKEEWVPLQREKINTLLRAEKERLANLLKDLEAINLDDKNSVAYYYFENENHISHFPMQQQYYPIVYNNKSDSKNYYLPQIQSFKSDVEKFKAGVNRLLDYSNSSSKYSKMTPSQYNQTILEVKKMATSLAIWIMSHIDTIVRQKEEATKSLNNRSFVQLVYEKALGSLGYHTQYYKEHFKVIENLNNKQIWYENIMKELSPYIDKSLKQLRQYSDGSSAELFNIASAEYHPEITISIEEKELEKLKKDFKQESKRKNNNLLEE